MEIKSQQERRFICGYIIEFTDGGEPEGAVLHEGTLDECERVMEMIPGVSYSGSRPIKSARMAIRELESAIQHSSKE